MTTAAARPRAIIERCAFAGAPTHRGRAGRGARVSRCPARHARRPRASDHARLHHDQADERAVARAARGSLDADRPRQLHYHVGSKNERPGRTGFAHLFEHLMFQGSKNVAPGPASVVHRLGRRREQRHDQRGLDHLLGDGAGALPAAGAVARGRSHGLARRSTSGAFTRERSVVKEERRQRIDSPPYGRLAEIVYDATFTMHPYKHQVIGSMADLEAARIDDVRDFYETFYVPENAVLVIAGDFDPKEATKLVEQYFGRVPKAKKPVPRDIPAEPPQTAERRAHRLRGRAAAGGGRRAPHHLRRPPGLLSAAHRQRSCRTATARASTARSSTRSGSRSAPSGGGNIIEHPEPVLRHRRRPAGPVDRGGDAGADRRARSPAQRADQRRASSSAPRTSWRATTSSAASPSRTRRACWRTPP